MGLTVLALGVVFTLAGLAAQQVARNRAKALAKGSQPVAPIESVLALPRYTRLLRWSRISVFLGLGFLGFMALATALVVGGGMLIASSFANSMQGYWFTTLAGLSYITGALALSTAWLRFGIHAFCDDYPAPGIDRQSDRRWLRRLASLVKKAGITLGLICAVLACASAWEFALKTLR